MRDGSEVRLSSKSRIVCALFVAIMVLWVAGASVEASTISANYRFYWGGLRVGKIQLLLHDDAKYYRVESTAKTSGIVRVFSKHKSHAWVRGVKRKGRYVPTHFRSEYERSDSPKLIELRYDANGVVHSETLQPPRKESRPIVEAKHKMAGVLDIFTTLLSMQQQLADTLERQETSFIAPIYDGKRRFDLHATIIDKNAVFDAEDRDQSAIALTLKRVPIAGYTAKERKKLENANPVVTFYVRQSDFLPLGLTAPIYGTTLRAELQRHTVIEYPTEVKKTNAD